MAEGEKVERRGGYRPGAGRKPEKVTTLTACQVERMLRKAKQYAKRHGKDLDDVLLEVLYTADESARNKIAAWKAWKELTMAKMSEDGPTNKELGPAVFLPEQRPTLTVVPGKKTS